MIADRYCVTLVAIAFLRAGNTNVVYTDPEIIIWSWSIDSMARYWGSPPSVGSTWFRLVGRGGDLRYQTSPWCELLRSDASDLLPRQGLACLCSKGLAAAKRGSEIELTWPIMHALCMWCDVMWCAFTRTCPALPTAPAYTPWLTMIYWVKHLEMMYPISLGVVLYIGGGSKHK